MYLQLAAYASEGLENCFYAHTHTNPFSDRNCFSLLTILLGHGMILTWYRDTALALRLLAVFADHGRSVT